MQATKHMPRELERRVLSRPSSRLILAPYSGSISFMNAPEKKLAHRLGVAVHISPLRMKIRRLQQQYPDDAGHCMEDWLLDTANYRGARVVVRHFEIQDKFVPPPVSEFSNEELVVAICQLQNYDRPQILRVAAQLISREAVGFDQLMITAERERVEIVLAEMARQALKVDPDHFLWGRITMVFEKTPRPRDPVIHWTRMAEPVPGPRGCNAVSWRLVA